MEYADVGGLKVSRVGMGGCPLGGHGWGAADDQKSIDAVRFAVDHGVNFFDTADIYGLGHSESLLADALGERRKHVVIASKFGVRRTSSGKTVLDISPKYMREALEASLRRLKLECLPLYYIHWPDGKTPLYEILTELEKVRAEGKIRVIGLSNFSVDDVLEAQKIASIAAVQVQYSLVDRQIAESYTSLPAGVRVPLVTWGSLAQGLLTGKYGADARFGDDDRRGRYENFNGAKFQENLSVVARIGAIAENLGKSQAEVAIRWLLETEGVGAVLFGAKTTEQVRENIRSAGEWKLPIEDYVALSELTSRLSTTAA